MIELVKDTIDSADIDDLIEWLKTHPRLTMANQVKEFESKWSEYIGTKYSVFLNSGSSANLAMIYALKVMKGKHRLSNKIVVPALSWATTVAPVHQLGMTPVVCDTDKETLGLDVEHLEEIFKTLYPFAVIVTHILGFPNKMKSITELCEKYGVIMLEDSCETVGSTYNGVKTGNFGLMSSFSMYFGHHLSTIEGGMVCTNDKELYDLLRMIRSHGWDRDLEPELQQKKRKEAGVNDFQGRFTFYVPGFNLRGTDLQAKIGIRQIGKLYNACNKRYENFKLYQELIDNDYWKPPYQYNFVSNFAYPVIHPKRDEIAKRLEANEVEVRPLISGSIRKQPVYKEYYDFSGVVPCRDEHYKFSDIVHKYGLYVPNHPELNRIDIEYISNIINEVINE